MGRRALGMVVCVGLIAVAGHVIALLSEDASAVAGPPETWSGLPKPAAVLEPSDPIDPATLPEVAALSTTVVEGTVTRVAEGPIVPGADGGLGMLRATIDVERTYQGSPGRRIDLLFTGFRPADGAIVAVDLELQPEPGDHGIWFLHPADLDAAPGAYLVSTSAGSILRTDRGTSVTGGESQAAAVACRRTWSTVRLFVTAAVTDGAGLVPLRPGSSSPHADPAFVGNPCARPRRSPRAAGDH